MTGVMIGEERISEFIILTCKHCSASVQVTFKGLVNLQNHF